MRIRTYSWWRNVKEAVQKYPSRRGVGLQGVALAEREAVARAIEDTERMADGANRLELIKLLHWDRTRTLDGAAGQIPCHRATAARWQREFFEQVARNRGLLD